MKPYLLPDLAYDYSALAPHYSARILELHHDKHHKAYVDGVNATLGKLAGARAADDLSAIVGLERTLAFNLSGHVLHTLFWQNLSPDGGDWPNGELAAAIDEHFGSFDAFRKQLSTSAASVQGSGGGALTWAECRCSSSMCGSTRTTSSTRTVDRITSLQSGTSSTGATSQAASNTHAVSYSP